MNVNSNASLKDLTSNDLLDFGLNDLAYLKATVVDGQPVFAIHAADGSTLALVTTKEVGIEVMQKHDLEPVALH